MIENYTMKFQAFAAKVITKGESRFKMCIQQGKYKYKKDGNAIPY